MDLVMAYIPDAALNISEFLYKLLQRAEVREASRLSRAGSDSSMISASDAPLAPQR